MKFRDLWEKISSSPTIRFTRININPENVDIKEQLQGNFERRQQYFLVKVNEMFLPEKRKWFDEYHPIVYVISEFLYDGEKREVPFVVGPSMLDKDKMKLPDKFIFQDTTVAGMHPFVGGTFTLNIVLSKYKTEKYLRKFLDLIQNTAGTYTAGFATMITQYLKVANVVLDSLESLTNSGDIQPVMGTRKEYNPEIVGNFKPGYFAMINEDENDLKDVLNKFYVKENRLYFGDTAESAKPYGDSEYLLYSILAVPTRSDVEALTFYKDWKKLAESIAEKNTINKDEHTIMKGKLFALQDGMYLSPDLIPRQADSLSDEFQNSFDKMVGKRLVQGAPEKKLAPKDPWEEKREERALKLLGGNN